LSLNAEKTKTLHANSGIDALWPTDLREHRFFFGSSQEARTIEHYFTKAFEFANEHPAQSVLDFAVKRTRSVRIQRRDWRIYESFLLRASRASPAVIPAVVQILVSYNHNRYPVDRGRIGKLIEDVIRKAGALGYHSEVAWVLFLSKALRIPLSPGAARQVSGFENSVVALLTLDLHRSGLVPRGLDTGLWRISMSSIGLKSHMWLLAYEADLKG